MSTTHSNKIPPATPNICPRLSPALLKLGVEELFSERHGQSSIFNRAYILQSIEEEVISTRNRLSRPNHEETTSSIISISDLYELVKIFDKDFTPGKTVNPAMLNEDGTQRTFITDRARAEALPYSKTGSISPRVNSMPKDIRRGETWNGSEWESEERGIRYSNRNKNANGVESGPGNPYNKNINGKKTSTNEFNIYGMSWAYNSTTEIGDQKIVFNPFNENWCLIECTKDEVEFVVIKQGN